MKATLPMLNQDVLAIIFDFVPISLDTITAFIHLTTDLYCHRRCFGLTKDNVAVLNHRSTGLSDGSLRVFSALKSMVPELPTDGHTTYNLEQMMAEVYSGRIENIRFGSRKEYIRLTWKASELHAQFPAHLLDVTLCQKSDNDLLDEHDLVFDDWSEVTVCQKRNGCDINIPTRRIHARRSSCGYELINASKIVLRELRLFVTSKTFTIPSLPSSVKRLCIHPEFRHELCVTMDCYRSSGLETICVSVSESRVLSVVIKAQGNVESILLDGGKEWIGYLRWSPTTAIEPLTKMEIGFLRKLKGAEFTQRLIADIAAFKNGEFATKSKCCLRHGHVCQELEDSKLWWKSVDSLLVLQGTSCCC